jgi:hypothetical protein
MPTLTERSHAEYLCNVLNSHLRVLPPEEDASDLAVEFVNDDPEAVSALATELLWFAARIAPKGHLVTVTTDGFKLVEA